MPEEVARAKRYIDVFIEIETEVKQKLGRRNYTHFGNAAHEYVEKTRGLRKADAWALEGFGDLRNSLSHNRLKQDEYLSIPTEAALAAIEAMRDRIVRPAKAYSYLQTNQPENLTVEVLPPSKPLSEVLELVRNKGYTQFPVLHGGEFIGLLTSKGLSIWLAEHAANSSEDGLIWIELESVTVGELLPKEETSSTVQFEQRDALLREVVMPFEENAHLEAVLLTETGRPSKPLAIITAFDLPLMRDHI